MFLDSGHFDYVLKGEAEYTLPDFLRAYEGKDDSALRLTGFRTLGQFVDHMLGRG